MKATWRCISSPIASAVGLASWIVSGVGIIIGAVGSAVVGFWVSVAGAVIFLPVAVICYLIGIREFWVALFKCLVS